MRKTEKIPVAEVRSVLEAFYRDAKTSFDESKTAVYRDYARHAMNCTRSIAKRLGITL